MLQPTVLNAVLFALAFCFCYYLALSTYLRKVVTIDPKKLLYYISVFSLFGVSGELFTDTIWNYLFHQPLWLYQLFPAHGGYVSFFFPLVWGMLGYYKYLNDTNLHAFKETRYIIPGIVMGAEAIVVEIVYNGLFHLLFGGYIFYYLPANLGPLSHLSCLQVVPFYFVVGIFTNGLVILQNRIGYRRNLFITIPVYWMILSVLVFL